MKIFDLFVRRAGIQATAARSTPCLYRVYPSPARATSWLQFVNAFIQALKRLVCK